MYKFYIFTHTFISCLQIKRYKTYVYLLQSKLPQIVNSMDAVPLAPTEIEEENVLNGTVADDEEEEEEEETEELEDAGRSPMPVNRYSYRAAIYSNLNGGGFLSGSAG